MRSTTFDMVAMAITAVVVILSTGGIITWRYFAQPGFRQPQSEDPRRPADRDESRVLLDR